jgi:hypothetical protein
VHGHVSGIAALHATRRARTNARPAPSAQAPEGRRTDSPIDAQGWNFASAMSDEVVDMPVSEPVPKSMLPDTVPLSKTVLVALS